MYRGKMPEKQQSAELPARPRSAFASEPEDIARGKDGRRLGGATNPRFTSEYWTPERREEQSRRAREAIAAGTFGAANGFHRRKTRKFQEIAAEHAQEKAEEIIQRLDAIIFNPNKHTNAQDILRAIEMYGKFEDWSVKNSREDEKAFRSMTNEQLEARLLETLGEAMGLDLAGVFDVEGEVVSEEVIALPAPDRYDPMNAELGGDRLRALADLAECEECDRDRSVMEQMLRDAGVDDEEVLQETLSSTRCVRHRVMAAVAEADEATG